MKKRVTRGSGNTRNDDTGHGVEPLLRRITAGSALFRVITIFLAALAVTTLACSASPAPSLRDGDNVPNARRILFIGNSLTYTNDLPRVVQALADSLGGGPLEVAMVAFPDFSLDDHRQAGEASKAIARGGWSVVVLQQGPSSLPESRTQLLAATRRFAEEIKKAGARPALYSVWPHVTRQRDFPRAIESYELAAKEVDGILLPVAAAWLAAWKRDSTLELYSSDGLHPSQAGTYVAAIVLYAKLTGQTVSRVPPRLRLRSGVIMEIAPAVAASLLRAAEEVLKER